MEAFSVVGKSVSRVDALEKVTGRTKYCGDLGLPGMLHCKVLGSTLPHARLIRVDTSRAGRLPGVRAVLTGKDIPEADWGTFLSDRPLLAHDTVRYVGEPVAVAAADTSDIAEEAAGLIKVDYEELPAVFDPEEAMGPNPPAILHPAKETYAQVELPVPLIVFEPGMPNVFTHFKNRKGDVEKGFQESDLVLESRFTRPRVHHGQMENHAALASLEADGSLTVWATDTAIYNTKHRLARCAGLPPSKVRIVAPYIGGGFGGKGSPLVAPLAGLLALKAGRPVKLVCDRKEVFVNTLTETPMIIYIKDGVKKDGTLVAREMKLILNAGAYSTMTLLVAKNAVFGAVGSYRLPNFKLDSYCVATNEVPAGAFRGFGSGQVLWAVESHMDMLAGRLGIDPIELRKKNLLEEGEINATGQVTYGMGAKKCLEKVAGFIGWGQKPESRYPKRRAKGIALCNKYTMLGTGSTVLVKVCDDGTIEVRHSANDMGQGCNTVLAQIAAEEFGVPVEQIRVIYSDTAITPYDFATVSSRTTFYTGNALRRACQHARQQIYRLAAQRLGVSPEDLEARNGKVFVKGTGQKAVTISSLFIPGGYLPGEGEIIGKGQFMLPYSPEDPETGQSERSVTYFAHGAAAVEVEVDEETGEVQVLRLGETFDMGQPINPNLVEGQIDGGMGMGIGSALYERVMIRDGVVLNPNFTDYKMPRAADVPVGKDSHAGIAPVPHKDGPFGAKGFTEGSLIPVAPAISNAIHTALGIRLKDIPLTPEKVLQATRDARKKGTKAP